LGDSRKWEDNINVDLEEIRHRSMDEINLAQNVVSGVYF
jgi:hypothetical protein